MWPVASFPQSFPKTFFGKPQSSLLTGSRSCQVSNGIKGSNATDYAGLRLDCTGGPAILFPFFAQSAEEPIFLHFRSRKKALGKYIVGVSIAGEILMGGRLTLLILQKKDRLSCSLYTGDHFLTA